MRNIPMSIKVKIPAAMIGLCLCAAALLVSMAYVTLRETTLREARIGLTQVAQERSRLTAAWFEDFRAATRSLAANPSVAESIGKLTASMRELGDDPLAALREVYITNNPYQLPDRSKLITAEARGSYHKRHRGLQEYFATVLQDTGAYDVFLISAEGDVLYTYAKEADFATNLANGPYAFSGLGVVFKQALALQAGELALSDYSAYEPSANAPAIFMATPIKDFLGNVVGVFALQLPMNQLSARVHADHGLLGSTGQTFLVGADGTARSDLRFGGVTSPGAFPFPPLPKNSGQYLGQLRENQPLQSGGDGFSLATEIELGSQSWTLVVERELQDVTAGAHSFLVKMQLTAAAIIAVVALVGLFLARSITKPVERLALSIGKINEGDLDTPVPDLTRRDEIGTILLALEGLRQTLADGRERDAVAGRAGVVRDQAIDVLCEELQKLSEGDLTRQIETVFPPELEAVREDFNRATRKLNGVLSDVTQSVRTISGSASDMGKSAASLTHRTETQAATLEQSVAALDELTQSVRSAADAAQRVNRIVIESRNEAEEGTRVVGAAITAMSEIESSSRSITQIIGVIDDIAFQTNLLALNAGVEAARAGEAGKGFAVVASEVRSLAQRSSTAAREIKQLIATSEAQVEIGVARVGETGTALSRIAERIHGVEGLVSKIAAMSSEQSTSLGEINSGMINLDSVTQQNSAMAGETETASQHIALSARHLGALVAQFATARAETAAMRDTMPASAVAMAQPTAQWRSH